MDPLSIIAGTVGLLGAAATVIKFLDTLKSTIRDAPKSVVWALAEVNDVRSTVARLHAYFEHLDSIPKDTRALVTVQDAAVTVSELVGLFDNLVNMLKPFGLSDPALMKRWDKVKWARAQDDIAKPIMKMQVHKGSITLILNIFQCESDIIAVQSRLTLESRINTAIEGNLDIQKRLERMERMFEACLNDAPSPKMPGHDRTHSDTTSARRPSTVAVKVSSPTQDASRIPVIKRQFEETLAETGVYRRTQQRPLDEFSIHSSDTSNRSVTQTIMTSYSLADNASVLSHYPIINRSELRHPEFYAGVETGIERNRESRFLSALAHRGRRSSDTRRSPQMSVPQQKVRTAPNCGPEVMGAWSALTRRIWRPTEFRFETQFEVPVIFVCPPSNKEGPIKNKPINFVCGTQRSLEATRVLLPRDEEKMESMRADRVHAADNEKASWVTLLSQLQSMETESQEWQLKHSRTGPRMATPSTEFYNHTLAVAIQTQTQSWDAMPPSVKKPCATTTFSHLLEIAAMMGMHWKEFNQSEKRYRAEGNGCMLRGTHIPELGLMFTFQVYGRVEFLGNRVIPVGEVRELCCGFVPTLFQETNKHQRRIDSPIRDLRDLNFLQLSSRDRIAETMVMVGCNTNTANYFCSHETKHSHLFPVPFELMGMLGKTLHIRNSAFRMLPNPTPYQWSTNSFELPQLVKEYWKNITASDLDLPRVPHVKKLGEDTSLLLEALYRDAKSRTPAYSIPLLNTVHDILDRCDNFLRGSDSDLVRIVVGEHFQAVLKMVNEERRMSNGDGRRGGRRRAEHFSELTAASPELREEVFMDLYFYKVFGQVRERAVTWCEQRRTAPRAGSGSPREPPAASVSAIWCTLVLRMMCWLLLHDFHRKDVQIPKSELLGSRIPVYIS